MKVFPLCLPALFALLLLQGCAQPPAPTAARGTLTQTNSLRVRTTAYTGSNNAIGGRLSHGAITSAASDWSQFPLGTRFTVRETGQEYRIDDYGSALVGTRTIDLCMPGSRAMGAWGVRWVTIDVKEWGSSRHSLEILAPREKARIVRRMILALKRQTKGVPEQFHRVDL